MAGRQEHREMPKFYGLTVLRLAHKLAAGELACAGTLARIHHQNRGNASLDRRFSASRVFLSSFSEQSS
jgi:hypothetical protein